MGVEPRIHKVKYEILNQLSEEGFGYSDTINSVGDRIRHSIAAYYQEYSLFIIRNYRKGEPRMQYITVVDLDDNKIYEKSLTNDIEICDYIAEAIVQIKIRSRR